MNHETAFSPSWRHWAVDPGTLTLVLQVAGAPRHSISLRGITSSACMLDAIFELREKDWVTDSILADLILAFQDLFDPRMTLCEGGKDHKINSEARIRSAIQ